MRETFLAAGEKYGFRADVEGLRAIAALAILAFHVDERWLPGGFAGVDVFFVISGYLITRQILESPPGAFGFAAFYRRRVRRLFPALAATVLASLIAGWRLFSPEDYRRLGESALASLGGVSNIYFYLTQDYFDASNLDKPLLHVWSLSLEEQFYLVWPAFLIFVAARARERLPVAIGVVALLSLAASHVATGRDPSFAFYMAPFRIFEFALGALLVPVEERRVDAARREVFGAVGAALVICSLLLLRPTIAWPGSLALAPALGAALMIHAGPRAAANRVTAHAALRAIGRRSYSIYLAHWPLIVFYGAWIATPLSLAEKFGLFAASLVGGALLYALIERPFRHFSPAALSPPWAPARLVAPIARGAAILAPLATLAFAAGVVASGGAPMRLDKGLTQRAGELTFAGDACNAMFSRCLFGDLSSSRIVYLMGDSHALNLVHGLDRLFKAHGVRGVGLYDHGCLFLEGTLTAPRGVVDRRCADNVESAYARVAADRRPVILVGDHDAYAGGVTDGKGAKFERADAAYLAWLDERLRASLRRIHAGERATILFNRGYNIGFNLPSCLLRPGADGAGCAPPPYAAIAGAAAPFDAMMERLREEFPRLVIIDPKRAFCPEGACATRAGGALLLRDSMHLTNEGSMFLIDRIGLRIMRAVAGGGE